MTTAIAPAPAVCGSFPLLGEQASGDIQAVFNRVMGARPDLSPEAMHELFAEVIGGALMGRGWKLTNEQRTGPVHEALDALCENGQAPTELGQMFEQLVSRITGANYRLEHIDTDGIDCCFLPPPRLT